MVDLEVRYGQSGPRADGSNPVVVPLSGDTTGQSDANVNAALTTTDGPTSLAIGALAVGKLLTRIGNVLMGGSLTDTATVNEALTSDRPVLTPSENIPPATVSGVVSVNFGVDNHQFIELDADITSLTLLFPTNAGGANGYTLRIRANGNAISWANANWGGAGDPDISMDDTIVSFGVYSLGGSRFGFQHGGAF